MRPINPNRPTHDPRAFLLNHGEAAFVDFVFRESGYLLRPAAMNDLAEALVCCTPLLLQGGAGTGKTALGFGLQKAFNLPHFHLYGRRSYKTGDVLYEWREDDRKAVIQTKIAAGLDYADVAPTTYTRPFLKLGVVGQGIDWCARHRQRCIIQVDELDKVTDDLEDDLLEPLEFGHIHVPDLQPDPIVGIDPNLLDEPGGEETWFRCWPLYLLTSNDSRKTISEPIRSRSLFHPMQPPSTREEFDIVMRKLPQAEREVLAQCAKVNNALRNQTGIKQKPEMRELLSLARSMVLRGVRTLTPQELERRMAHLAKTSGDRKQIAEMLAFLCGRSEARHPEIDGNPPATAQFQEVAA